MPNGALSIERHEQLCTCLKDTRYDEVSRDYRLKIFQSLVWFEVTEILFSLWIAFEKYLNDLPSYGIYAELSALSNGVLENIIRCLFNREN